MYCYIYKECHEKGLKLGDREVFTNKNVFSDGQKNTIYRNYIFHKIMFLK